MSDTTFVNRSLPLIDAGWLNEVNDHVHHDALAEGRTHLHVAEKISYTPMGALVATDVQAAVSELDTEKAKAGANSDITSLAGLTTPLSVAQGGTGTATLTANNVVLGNGASAVAFVAPSTSGNVLTSDGTKWASTALPAASGLGIGQAWQDVKTTPGRLNNTVYQNLTGNPIAVVIVCQPGDGVQNKLFVGTANPPTILVDWQESALGSGLSTHTLHTVVPNNHYYKTENVTTIHTWSELR